jgi:hypothetical protein
VEGVVSKASASASASASDTASDTPSSAQATGIAGAEASPRPPCLSCGAPLGAVVADLGMSPLANSYVEPDALDRAETFFPLCARLCESCFLVQLPAAASSEAIFSEYAYFSSYSDSWLRHARDFVAMAASRFRLGSGSLIVEVASNDGYLLQYARERGIPVLGIEPARNVAEHAEARGVPTLNRFLGAEVAREVVAGTLRPEWGTAGPLLGRPADLVVANNVFAHTPELSDFTAGLAALLAPQGVLTIEVQHLLRLLDQVQFDTIYHEHFTYYSLHAAKRVLETHGLELFDVEELETHGGSLRMFARRRGAAADARLEVSERVERVLAAERAAGLLEVATYRRFQARVQATKRRLLEFLIQARDEGRSVVGYGAPAKGNTLLNYCGVGTDLLDYTVDRSPHKQGRFLPGSRIPIHAPERLRETRPDYVLILPWNLETEIVEQQAEIREWGGRFVVAIPEVRVS